MAGIHVVDNKYLAHLLTVLRDRGTPPRDFRRYLRKAGEVLAIELSREMPSRPVEVLTPLGVKARGVALESDKIVLVAVLRAAIPMLEGFLEVYEDARVGFVSARRIEEGRGDGRFPVEINYINVPVPGKDGVVVLIDPMIATGSTISSVVSRLNLGGVKLIVAGLIAAPQGVKRILSAAGSVSIYVASLDEGLNDRGYIVPGLGDAGDRCFNT